MNLSGNVLSLIHPFIHFASFCFNQLLTPNKWDTDKEDYDLSNIFIEII